MALSKATCGKAIDIFKDIAAIKNSTILVRDEFNENQEGYIIGMDKKADDGWESLFINVSKITPDQLDIWNARKKSVPNSSSLKEIKPGLTRLGFY